MPSKSLVGPDRNSAYGSLAELALFVLRGPSDRRDWQ
jgi:hypothetical protein